MKKIIVGEGNTGVLELIDEQGNKEIFQPDCDLDKSLDLLYEFYEILTVGGVKVKDTFQKDGVDWFPTSISFLYWQIFYQFVKYKPLVDTYLAEDTHFIFNSLGRFSKLIGAIDATSGHDSKFLRNNFRKIYHGFVQLRNRVVVKKKGGILFFRYSVDDFRTKELFKSLKKKYQVTQVAHAPKRSLFRCFFDPQVYIVTASSALTDFNIVLPKETPDIFKIALYSAQSLINSHLGGYQSHLKQMRSLSYKLFFGLDDTNIVYPLIYAAQDAGIKTLGFQHGLYARRHESYIMKGIDRYRWFDNVLVWGEYWKNIILRYSDMFQEGFHLLSSNKINYNYEKLPKNCKEKTVLIPYEFLADSIKVGEYIRKFVDKGYVVYFKTRPDEKIEDQINSYYLEEIQGQIRIVESIDPELMRKVDVIAGTYSTLLFDLLPYGKPTWILETSFRLMYDMVDDGLARMITDEDMERIDEIYHLEMSLEREVDQVFLFGSKPVPEVIDEYLTTRHISE